MLLVLTSQPNICAVRKKMISKKACGWIISAEVTVEMGAGKSY